MRALGFRRGSALLLTQLAVIAFVVIGLPVLIGLAGFELHGFPANAADWELWFRGDRGVRDVGHELVSRRESSVEYVYSPSSVPLAESIRLGIWLGSLMCRDGEQ